MNAAGACPTLSPAQMASMQQANNSLESNEEFDAVPQTIPYGAFQPAPMSLQSTQPAASQPDLLARALPGVQSAPRSTARPTASTPLNHRLEKEDSEKKHSQRTFLANAFTMFVLALFAAPTIISLQLGVDGDASFWIGRWGLLAMFVPVFLLGQHFYHLWMLENKNRRRRYIFVIVPVLPAVLFMVIGGTYMSVGKHIYGQLKADDCEAASGLSAKYWMQEAYEEAHSAYTQCIARLQRENGDVPLQRHPNLQSCTEWEVLMESQNITTPWKGHRVSPNTLRLHNPSNNFRWQYLANTELKHLCGGFCKQGPPLFASYDLTGRMGGSCAQFVAFRFLWIMQMGLVIFYLGIAIFLASLATYLASRVALTNLGYKSGLTIA